MSLNPTKLHEILSHFPEKYGKEQELKPMAKTDKNVEVANAQKISDLKSLLKEHVLHNSGSSSSVISSLPELLALDPDLVAEKEKKRKLRKALN